MRKYMSLIIIVVAAVLALAAYLLRPSWLLGTTGWLILVGIGTAAQLLSVVINRRRRPGR